MIKKLFEINAIYKLENEIEELTSQRGMNSWNPNGQALYPPMKMPMAL